MMKKMMSLLFAVAAAVSVCSCRTQIVTVDVAPADATIIANGVEYTNKSPIFVEASTSRQLLITAYKEGYRDRIYAIDYQLSTLGKVEAWTSIFILPAFGLLFDTAWELKENNVALTLDPVSQEAKAEAAGLPARTNPVNGYNNYSGDPADVSGSPAARQIFNEIK